MKLIDADKLVDCVNTVQELALAMGGDLDAIQPVNEGFISLVKSQPTVEAIPVEFVLKRMKEYTDCVEDNADLYAVGVLGMLITAWKKE